MKTRNRSVLLGMLICAIIVALLVNTASAFTMGDLQTKSRKALEGKKIVFITAAMMFEVVQAWEYVIRTESKKLGMEYQLVDAVMQPDLLHQGLKSQIKKHPDIIVIHNMGVQQLARDIAKAEKNGIHVIQLSLPSLYISDVYVGLDMEKVGRSMVEEIVKDIGKGSGTSGKLAILAGSLSSNDAVIFGRVKDEIFAKHPEIKVVLYQATGWKPSKARELTAMVLQQHPDLAGIWGYYGLHTIAAGHSVKEAGLQDKVKVYTQGDASKPTWDAIEAGLLDKVWAYNPLRQGYDVMNAVKMILQDGDRKAGKKKLSLFTSFDQINKDNYENRKDLYYVTPKE
jgi:ribose transport system substrate-binding protein